MFLSQITISTADEDLETVYGEFFIPYLEEVLEVCDSFLDDLKDILVDNTDSYFPNDLSTLNTSNLKAILKAVKELQKTK